MPAAVPALSFSLHLQPVSRMERLAIESCIDAGYEHRGYAYGDPNKLGTLPVPANYHDANKIFPESMVPKDPEAQQKFALAFMCRAMYTHGGLWIDNDYVLTRPMPQSPFLAVRDPDRDGLSTFALRLPAGSTVARLAMQTAETKLKKAAFPAVVLMDSILSNWPVRSDARILTAAEACPFGRKHAQMLINPAPELDQERVYGYKLWRHVWEHEDCTPSSKFHHMSPYEQLWGRYFGMREK